MMLRLAAGLQRSPCRQTQATAAADCICGNSSVLTHGSPADAHSTRTRLHVVPMIECALLEGVAVCSAAKPTHSAAVAAVSALLSCVCVLPNRQGTCCWQRLQGTDSQGQCCGGTTQHSTLTSQHRICKYSVFVLVLSRFVCCPHPKSLRAVAVEGIQCFTHTLHAPSTGSVCQ